MSNNVKEALELLCRYIRSLINVRLDPKDFTSAENDSKDPQVVSIRFQCTTLDDLSVACVSILFVFIRNSGYEKRCQFWAITPWDWKYAAEMLRAACLELTQVHAAYERPCGTRSALVQICMMLLIQNPILQKSHDKDENKIRQRVSFSEYISRVKKRTFSFFIY